MTLRWIRCSECFHETLKVYGSGKCELCVTMKVMEPTIAAINAGMEATGNRPREPRPVISDYDVTMCISGSLWADAIQRMREGKE